MSRKPVEALFEQITDPVERALQRELYRLETEIAHLLHLQNDTPWIDAFDLQKEVQAWMIEHATDPAKTKLAKLAEFEARSKPIERRLARWKRQDLCALMDRGFELRRQVDQIHEARQSIAWYGHGKRADETMLAKWRVFIRLEEIHLEALSKLCAKRAQKATPATEVPA